MMRHFFAPLSIFLFIATTALAGDIDIGKLKPRFEAGDPDALEPYCAALVRSGRNTDPALLRIALTRPTFDPKELSPIFRESTAALLARFGIQVHTRGGDESEVRYSSYSLDLAHPHSSKTLKIVSDLIQTGKMAEVFQKTVNNGKPNFYHAFSVRRRLVHIRSEMDFIVRLWQHPSTHQIQLTGFFESDREGGMIPPPEFSQESPYFAAFGPELWKAWQGKVSMGLRTLLWSGEIFLRRNDPEIRDRAELSQELLTLQSQIDLLTP